MAEEEGIRQHRFTRASGATTVLGAVRHGESEAEVPGKPFPLRDGHGDPALHPEGVRQAELLADRLQHERIDAIYVTTLRRTHQTAAPLAARLGLTPIEEPDLREVFLGEWEGGIFRHVPSTTTPCSRRSSARNAGMSFPAPNRTKTSTPVCGAASSASSPHIPTNV